MVYSLKSSFIISLFTVAFFSVATTAANAAAFTNPLLRFSGGGCAPGNLIVERFTPDVSQEARLSLCNSIDKMRLKLNSVKWSQSLSVELQNIWQVFSMQRVFLRSMPKNVSSKTLAMAEVFPFGVREKNLEAGVYLRPEKSGEDAFFQVFFHELRHIYDFYETWIRKGRMDAVELERRAFRLMGKISQETPESENFANLPRLWDDSWKKLSAQEIQSRRETAIENYLREHKIYRNLADNNQSLDFTFLNRVPDKSRKPVNAPVSRKGGERLPDRQTLPKTATALPQNIREVSFNLDRPRNKRDEKEILRVALANEKKLYYGMSNFVYDQRLNFQCWKNGVPVETLTQKNTLARNDNGSVLFSSGSSPLLTKSPGCVMNYDDLKTDFTETFWASPALDKMPIRFVGFVEDAGRTLAQYIVLRPDDKLYRQLARRYSPNKHFRVFVGTIFVSPADGQIVKFWGTSYPEDVLTGNNSRKVIGSYSVTAVRQKLNLQSGVWVTVFVGTVGMSKVEENPFPFSYTVNYNNYRQSTTDVRILED